MKGYFTVDENEKGKRLDVVFNLHYPDFSRSHIKTLIDQGSILLQNKFVKSGEKLKTGQKVSFDFQDVVPLQAKPQNIDFEIVYQDQDLLVVN